jgi:hypothetical protein
MNMALLQKSTAATRKQRLNFVYISKFLWVAVLVLGYHCIAFIIPCHVCIRTVGRSNSWLERKCWITTILFSSRAAAAAASAFVVSILWCSYYYYYYYYGTQSLPSFAWGGSMSWERTTVQMISCHYRHLQRRKLASRFVRSMNNDYVRETSKTITRLLVVPIPPTIEFPVAANPVMVPLGKASFEFNNKRPSTYLDSVYNRKNLLRILVVCIHSRMNYIMNEWMNRPVRKSENL